MTATTTWDPAAGDGYLPKTVTVLLPPLTVRSAADGEKCVPCSVCAIGGLTCALAAS